MRDSFKYLIGSVVVYVAIAACGSQTRVDLQGLVDAAADALDGGADPVDSEGTSVSEHTSASETEPDNVTLPTPQTPDAAVPGPSILDPVPTASAQPEPETPTPCQCEPAPAPVVEQPQFIDALCEPVDRDGVTLMIAEAEIADKTTLALARSVALLHWPSNNRNGAPYGYRSGAVTVYVREGAIAVVCGVEGTPAEETVTSVTFIVP